MNWLQLVVMAGFALGTLLIGAKLLLSLLIGAKLLL